MRIKKYVELSDEVEINLDLGDVIACLNELDNATRLHEAKNILNTCIGLINRVPNTLIAELDDGIKKRVVEALQLEIKRYA